MNNYEANCTAVIIYLAEHHIQWDSLKWEEAQRVWVPYYQGKPVITVNEAIISPDCVVELSKAGSLE